jgi:hypothetical protein
LSKDPAFLFYHHDFLVGTELMTIEEVGLYIRILCHLADKGRLSLTHMQSICKGYAFSNTLKEKFLVDKDGFYFNERLRLEVEKRKLYAESRRKNAKAYAKHMEDVNRNRNKDIVKDMSIGDLIIKYPYLKDKEFVDCFESYLKTRKKKATDRAKELILKDLHRVSQAEAIAMLEQSIKNGWIGIFPIKKEFSNGKDRGSIEQKYAGVEKIA